MTSDEETHHVPAWIAPHGWELLAEQDDTKVWWASSREVHVAVTERDGRWLVEVGDDMQNWTEVLDVPADIENVGPVLVAIRERAKILEELRLFEWRRGRGIEQDAHFR